MKKIESLTKEQIDQMPFISNEWIKIGLSTERANRTIAEKWCREAYKIAGLNEPKMIFWAESPIGLLITAKLLKEVCKKEISPLTNKNTDSAVASVRASVRDSVGASVWDSVEASVGASVTDSVWDSVGASVRASVRDSVEASVGASVGASVKVSVWASVRDSVEASVEVSVGDSFVDSGFEQEWDDCRSWGQHDASWLSFYDYFRRVIGLTEITSKLVPLTELAKETGWHLFYRDIAILSEKPISLHRNEQGQLHNYEGPAIEWKDGYKLHRWNGVRNIPEKYLGKADFTKDEILKERNADIRREMIRKIGIVKAVEILGAKTVDKFNGYELLTIDLGDNRWRPYLKMQNPSIDVVHIEGVHPDCKTVKEALAWRNGLDKYVEPKILT